MTTLTAGAARVQFHLTTDVTAYRVTASAPGRREYRAVVPVCECNRPLCDEATCPERGYDEHGYTHCHGTDRGGARHLEQVEALAAALLRSYAVPAPRPRSPGRSPNRSIGGASA